MLTPIEIKGKKLKGGIGYSKKDVDAFMYQILDNYETLYKNNKDLDEKNSNLASTLASYKAIESQLEKSLVLAEKAAEDTRANAKAEANTIINDAKIEAQKMLINAKEELKDIEDKIVKLNAQYEAYKANVKAVALSQIELMDASNLKAPKTSKDSFDEKIKEDDDFINLEVAASINET